MTRVTLRFTITVAVSGTRGEAEISLAWVG